MAAEVIFSYSREQAIEDGVLVDVTAWAGGGPEGMHGGFSIPVAFTAALWASCQPPKRSSEDRRGRAHDVLWMAACAVRAAVRRGNDGSVPIPFEVKIGRRRHQLFVAFSGHDGFTIGYPSDF